MWKRKILTHSLCQICGSSVKNTFHALIECKSTRKIWKITQAAAEIRSIAAQDILGVIQDLEKRIGKAETELVVALFWVAWSARNQVLFKGKREDPHVLAVKAEAVVEEFKRIRVPTSRIGMGRKKRFKDVGASLQ